MGCIIEIQPKKFLVITVNAHCLLDKNNGQYM